MSKTRRTSLTLPEDVIKDLDFVASRFNVSRSGFLSQLLRETLPPLVTLTSLLPEDGSEVTEETSRRLRGVSADLIADQVRRLLVGIQDEDDSDE